MPILKKRSYMLHKTLLVLTVYLVAYIFLQNYFLRFRKSGMQCWTFETSISLLVSLSWHTTIWVINMFRFFYCFNLLQQMFPAGIADVIFLSYFAKTTKSKKRAHILFFTNVSSLFLFDTKKEHLNNLDTLDLYFFQQLYLIIFLFKSQSFL